MSVGVSVSEGIDSAVVTGIFVEFELVGLDLVGDASPEFDSCPKNEENFFPGNLGVVGVLVFSLDASTCFGFVLSTPLGVLFTLATRIAPAVLGRTP
jgi:hypothetical protein